MEKYLPTLLITSLLIRCLVFGAGLGDALALVALSGLYGFSLFLSNKKEPLANKELWDRLIAAEEAIKVTREKVSVTQFGNTLKR